MPDLSAFRLGDIRGIYPDEINESFMHDFAQAFVGHFGLSGRLATGRDMRASSASLQQALNDALTGIGMEVVDIGLCPTELGYFASAMPGMEAAIIVTASHNAAYYNGLKCVLSRGQAITFDNGLQDIKALMQEGYRHPSAKGSLVQEDFHSRYLDFLRRSFPPDSLQGGAIALNGLNGTAATMASLIATEFGLPASWFRKQPGPMPEEGADPANPRLAEEMRGFMQDPVHKERFSLGVAWDGDCDRCVCFDGEGQLVPAYYLVGLLAGRFLAASPGAAIVFDTKLCWNTLAVIEAGGGKPVPSATGHAFMKQKMHESGAVYGGELSSHHYFGDFFGCDSGMFAWLTMLQLLNNTGASLHELVDVQRQRICCTPEINLTLTDIDAAFAEVQRTYSASAKHTDTFDGLSFEMPGDWRFSLR
ncbi:MAG: hypothetical protein ACR2PJ_05245, partial [Pseudomonadales bacterium]